MLVFWDAVLGFVLLENLAEGLAVASMQLFHFRLKMCITTLTSSANEEKEILDLSGVGVASDGERSADHSADRMPEWHEAESVVEHSAAIDDRDGIAHDALDEGLEALVERSLDLVVDVVLAEGPDRNQGHATLQRHPDEAFPTAHDHLVLARTSVQHLREGWESLWGEQQRLN